MSISLTGADLVTRSLQTLGLYAPNETPSAEDIATGFSLLNELVDSWAIQGLTVLRVKRRVFALISGRGAPTNPYTLGPGGDWDTLTDARPVEIDDAALLLAGTTPIEIPLPILTPDMYAEQTLKTLTNTLPNWLYYDPTVPLGQVYLGNVPTDAANSIVLYTPVLTAQFVDLSTLYVCAPGYLKAFRLNLCEAMLTTFAVPATIAATIRVDAAEALSQVQTSNLPMSDLSLDPMFLQGGHSTYNIFTDEGA